MSLLGQPLRRNGVELLHSIKAILFDCDGVIWKGNQPISGAVDALNYLKKLGKSIYYVTNNSTKSRQEVLKKLQGFGVNSSLDEIITSSYATAQYLKDQPDHGEIYVVGEDGIYNELEAVGIKCHGREDAGETDVNVIKTMNSLIRTVVVGLDRQINYVKLSRAASYIRDYGCSFVATNTDASYPYPDNILAGGSGCIVAAIQVAAGRKPDCVVGKPNRAFIDLIRSRQPELQHADILMVGDRLDTDIVFAKRNQIHSLLVLSGVTTEEGLKQAEEALLPEFYTNSLQDVFALLSSQQ